jgi:hypothetical protein
MAFDTGHKGLMPGVIFTLTPPQPNRTTDHLAKRKRPPAPGSPRAFRSCGVERLEVVGHPREHLRACLSQRCSKFRYM